MKQSMGSIKNGFSFLEFWSKQPITKLFTFNNNIHILVYKPCVYVCMSVYKTHKEVKGSCLWILGIK